jgi:hypothetical protein
MRNWNVVASVVVCVAVSAAVYGQQQKRVRSLAPEDYAEIQQLYARFNWALDSTADDGKAYARTFTPDGEFIVNSIRAAAGREQLAQHALKQASGLAGRPHHLATNILVEATPEGARGGAYFLLLNTPAADQPIAITTTGAYEDTLVKTPEGWRFKQRKFTTRVLPATAAMLSN